MKQCNDCKEVKPLTEFYRHPGGSHGVGVKCKFCCIKREKERRLRKIDEIRAYDRARGQLPYRQEANRLRQKTERGAELHREANKRYKERYKNRAAARYIFGNAIRDGKLHKMPCFVCGEEKAEGHHPDYERPLDVVWLCMKHHKETHKLANEIFRRKQPCETPTPPTKVQCTK